MPMFLFLNEITKGVPMFRSFLIKISQLSLLILILTGCSPKQDIQFKTDDHFQKVVSIPLTELETQAMNVYTDFGFYAVEPELSRISKYNNAGLYEFSFGHKGRGPGEFESGVPISYDEINQVLGIWDMNNSKNCYFDVNGNFISSETIEFTGRDYFTHTDSDYKIHSYLTIKEEIGSYSLVNHFKVNDKEILRTVVSKNDQRPHDKILYSINNSIPYIMELSNKKLKVYTYLSDKKELQELKLTGFELKPENGIYSFISFDDFLIFMEKGGTQHYYDLSGNFLGTTDPQIDHIMFDGAYGEYIYLANYVDSEMESIDIYKAK